MGDDGASTLPPRCPECGQMLGDARVPVTAKACPECGVPIDREAPWRPPPWPEMPRLLVRLVSPALGLAIALSVLFMFPEVRAWLVWPLWLTWILALLFAGFIWPWLEARALAEARIPRMARRAVVRQVALCASALNAIVIVTALVIIRRML
jgi:hypothetical protein